MRYILKRSRAQERRVAAEIGGRRQPGSGNQWFAKSDVSSPRFLVECKRTDRESFSLKAKVLAAAKAQAYRVGKTPVVAVEIGAERWAVVPWDDWLALVEE